MKKCLIWGIGAEYDQYVNHIQYQVLKGHISITAYVSKDKYCSILDGKPVLTPQEINVTPIDYIIICNTMRFKEIKQQAIDFGVSQNKIISCDMLALPYFDFKRYIDLIENPVSIISDDCWGAEAYHYLNFPFSTPFILCYMTSNDYIRLLENFQYYMMQTPQLFQEADIAMGKPPIGYLGGGGSEPIKLYFNHSVSFEKAKENWQRRKERMNWNNLFVKMVIPNDEIAERFIVLPFEKKVGFYSTKSKWDSIYCLNDWNQNEEYMRRIYGYSYPDYVRNMVRGGKTRSFDLLKMLCGENDFMKKM